MPGPDEVAGRPRCHTGCPGKYKQSGPAMYELPNMIFGSVPAPTAEQTSGRADNADPKQCDCV